MPSSSAKRNAQARAWRRRNPKWYLRWSAMRRAKRQGIEFDLTLEDIPDIPEICSLALIPIFIKEYDGNQGPCDNSPTLDRIDPAKGYVRDNIAVISHRANRWKGEMTYEEILRVAEYMRPPVASDEINSAGR
jgi:hypothetical protein